MASKKIYRRTPRNRAIECLEERRVMAADSLRQLLGAVGSQHDPNVPPVELHRSLVDAPLEQHGFDEVPPLELHGGVTSDAPPLVQHNPNADFWLDSNSERDLDAMLGDIEQMLASAHGVTGMTQVRNNYGFIGTGQTVAVIDSGIAYDHYALGGGFGANHRVVGGWDFTEENDSNPYDDGPSGSHGTHVSGIVGGDRIGTADDGVAPGVDLVGLRVFNDIGDGYFDWVESALQWVHQNRNAFENPITAVNLSLGTDWNATTVPSWSTMEDEFAQLKADGIFITVSAGNKFTNYNTTGLSYPAASPNVVPVMSVDDNGALSFFSQRHPNAIAAPGRFIVSTVPDYIGNHNGVTDDFASFSGTSMAAPYVGGSSVIVREAMQFVGYTNITQDTIFNHMMATADTFFDSATGLNYKRLNMNSAINALMPSDDYGSTAATAHNLGTLSSSESFSGLIGTVNDKDFFKFTASASGTVSLVVSATHSLAPNVTVTGGQAAYSGGAWSFDVVAGQDYTISLETAAGQGIGYYDADLSLQQDAPEPPPAPVIVKTQVGGDGSVFSLTSDGWVYVNGSRVWQNTYDFTLGTDGTLYWQSTSGGLQHRLPNGTWEAFDDNATKFTVSSNGTIYSLGDDGWLSVNGWKAWNNTYDFELAADQTLYWHCNNGLVQHRVQDGSWQNVGFFVRFALRDNVTLYGLNTSNILGVNGVGVWSATQDFMLGPDQSLHWLCTNGVLQRQLPNATWQDLDVGVNEFAIAHDGSIYTLRYGGNVNVNGVSVWTSVVDLQTDATGCLVLEYANGTTHTVAGRFVLNTESSRSLGSSGAPERLSGNSHTFSGATLSDTPPVQPAHLAYMSDAETGVDRPRPNIWRSAGEGDYQLGGQNSGINRRLLDELFVAETHEAGQFALSTSSKFTNTIADNDDLSTLANSVDDVFARIGRLVRSLG